MLSAITFIFSKDEVDYIEPCLKSISWADEIIVVDNGAPKETLAIVKKYRVKIYPFASEDFAARHNFAAEKASGDWILYIDADERVSVALKDEIIEALKKPGFEAYEILRINYFLGKEAKYGDRNPDYVTRLFKKDKLREWTGEIHESSNVEGRIAQLKGSLFHLTHRDIYSMVLKTVNFSEHEANLRFEANHPPVVWWRLVRVFVTEAWKRIIVMQGWRQGTEGWIDGFLQAFSVFIVYARLWEKQRKPPLAQTYQEIDRKIELGEM